MSACATGGRGGSIVANDAFLAVLNTTIIGSTKASPDAAMQTAPGKGSNTPWMQPIALNGGCLNLDSGTLYVAGSSFSRCSAHLLGGAMSMLKVTSVVLDTAFDSSSADQVRQNIMYTAAAFRDQCSV
jgi:hypothetical protein